MGRNIFGDAESKERVRSAYISLARPVPHPLLPQRQMKVIYILPPAFRPLLHGGEDLNRHYRTILIANRRLKKSSDDIDTQNWRALVQAVAGLFGRRAQFKRDGNVVFRKLESHSINWQTSLPARFEGKGGLLRGYLLGKRVDFSGRAVIVPDPSLPFGSCRLPHAAIEVFEMSLSDGVQKPATEAAIKSRPILLNRAPSLHRYNLLSFELDPERPSWNEPVIAIHPLVCAGFGADFDGDTMAFHLPLSDAALKEARERLVPHRHLFSAAHGRLMLHLAQDIVAGVYLLSADSVGRTWLSDLLGDPSIAAREAPLCKDDLITIVERFLKRTPHQNNQEYFEALKRVDSLMRRAFQEGTERGLSVSITDLHELMVSSHAQAERSRVCGSDSSGLHKRLGRILHDELTKKQTDHPIGVLILSGARGDPQQLARLCGSVVTLSDGRASTCYVEGLSPLEYFRAAKEAREDMKPKKLGTPKGGDLMRKLIYGLYPIRIVSDECEASEGLEVPITLVDHLVGKYAAEDIAGIADYAELISVDIIERISQNTRKTIRVFSPITCQAERGVCARCYGWDLSTHRKSEAGLPIGILAAQSIGERATQDFMRVFHGVEAGLLKKISAAKALMETGRLPESISDDPTPSVLITWLVEAYEGQVNLRHFEVVLRQMNTTLGWCGLTRVAQRRNAQSPLAASAFRSPVGVLVDAAEKGMIDELDAEPETLFVGGRGGEADHAV